MLRLRFTISFDLRSTVWAPEVIKWKFIVFFTEMVFHWQLFDMRDMKIKMTPSCSPRRAGLATALFTLKYQYQNLTSGQVRSRSGHDPSRPIINMHTHLPKRLDEPSRLAPFASLYPHPVTSYWRKTDCDLRWPSHGPRLSVAPGSSHMGWVIMTLKELGGFG